MDRQELKQNIQKLKLAKDTVIWLSKFLWEEKQRGTRKSNIKTISKGSFAEDEIMASVKLVSGKALDPKELISFLDDKLAKFAIPRYIRFVKEFPMTSTHRVIKKELEKIGITQDTYDSQRG